MDNYIDHIILLLELIRALLTSDPSIRYTSHCLIINSSCKVNLNRSRSILRLSTRASKLTSIDLGILNRSLERNDFLHR